MRRASILYQCYLCKTTLFHLIKSRRNVRRPERRLSDEW